jgi:hypothetical protein
VNGWDLAKVDLDSFAEALQDIRTAAPTRLMLIVDLVTKYNAIFG